jgi:hypothetical protein
MNRAPAHPIVCPLCREDALRIERGRGECEACGARLEVHAADRRARLTHIPDAYQAVESELVGRWMTRGEMFDAVDRLLASTSTNTYDDDDEDAAVDGDADDALSDGEIDAAEEASRPWLLPLTGLAGLLTLGCLCFGALGIGAVFYATRPDPVQSASVRAQPGSDTLTATVGLIAPSVVETAALAPTPQTDPLSATETPLPGALPDVSSPPELDSPLLTPTPSQSVLPNPTEPPATATQLPTIAPTATAAPTSVPTAVPTARQPTALPPTFTPLPPTAPAVPTQTPFVITSTPLPTPTITPVRPTATATITPTQTPVPPLGKVLLSGFIEIVEVRYNAASPGEDYVRLKNLSNEQQLLDGLELQYIIPGRDPTAKPEPFEFPSGAVLLGNRQAVVYINRLQIDSPTESFYNWAYDGGDLFPNTPGAVRISVRLVNTIQNKELARFTY